MRNAIYIGSLKSMTTKTMMWKYYKNICINISKHISPVTIQKQLMKCFEDCLRFVQVSQLL